MKSIYFILLLLFSIVCTAADASNLKFKLNFGVGGNYGPAFQQFQENWFVVDTSYSNWFARGTLYPAVNIGMEITPQVSLFLHYSHFLVITGDYGGKIPNMPYLGIQGNFIPSRKFSQFYLSSTIGCLLFLQSWAPAGVYSPSGPGAGVTIACGYRVIQNFRVQADLNVLVYRISPTINSIAISSDTWTYMLIGLSAFWDIF